jgi:aspartate/methionine/tyrosine aminotransferase
VTPTAAGVGYVRPEGAFYLMVVIPDGETSLQYAERLLREQAVAVVPGSAFGPHGEGYIRIALSVADGVLDEAITRIVRSNERPQTGREATA